MFRREFVKDFFYSLMLFLFRPLKTLKAQTKYKHFLKIVLADGKKTDLTALMAGKAYYLNLDDFANLGNYGIFTNNTRKKSVLKIGEIKLKFTADNPFVVVNDQIIQILNLPVWNEGSVWVPVREFCQVVNDFTELHLEYLPNVPQIRFGAKSTNVLSVSIEQKANGTLIALNTTKPFPAGKINTRLVNGWLYLELIGGKGNIKTFTKKLQDPVVAEMRAVQFDRLLSIGFRLKKIPHDYEAIYNPDLSQVLLTLRFKEIAQNDTQEEQPAENVNDELENQKSAWMIDTIVIDPGHGGKDPGALGYYHLKEKDIVLKIALKLGEYLKKRLPDVKILFTRKTDVFIPLWQRTQFANQNNGKLFVSIHCNSNPRHSVNGFETYFLSADKNAKASKTVLLENKSIEFETSEDKKRYQGINFVLATMAQNAFIKYSQYLATIVQRSLRNRLRSEGMKDRGVKQGPFYVMVNATMPNVLVETGFISNKHEARLLRSKSTQAKVALGICDGIIKFKKDFESAL